MFHLIQLFHLEEGAQPGVHRYESLKNTKCSNALLNPVRFSIHCSFDKHKSPDLKIAYLGLALVFTYKYQMVVQVTKRNQPSLVGVYNNKLYIFHQEIKVDNANV
jgi:hypothetical protein